MNIEDLKKKSVVELREIAHLMGITPGSKKKEELIQAISNPAELTDDSEINKKKRGRPSKTASAVVLPDNKADNNKNFTQDNDTKPVPVSEEKSAGISEKKSAISDEKMKNAPAAKKTHRVIRNNTENKTAPDFKDGSSLKTDKATAAENKVPADENLDSAENSSVDNETQKGNKPHFANRKKSNRRDQRKDSPETEEEKAETTENSPSESGDESVSPDVKQEKAQDDGKAVVGFFEQMPGEVYGFLRVDGFYQTGKDIFVAPPLIKKMGLRNGDKIAGKARTQSNGRDNLVFVNTINGKPFSEIGYSRPHFEKLTPIYPDERLKMELSRDTMSTRLIDIIAPIGKGQRGLIVSPPKAGKTVLLKEIANSISSNYPDVELIVLLIDERPEEVTDITESVNGLVVASCFDELPERHVKVSEMCLQHAQRLVETGKDVVILMDSVTRLARAYNMTITPTGRSLSGGLDPGALYGPKKFFGAARNIRDGGSLTIVATALVDTGSRLDDVIYEEFKGTGNMELHLDRSLAEKRIYPAIDIKKSGTRREDLLLSQTELDAAFYIRKAISKYENDDATEILIKELEKYSENKYFIANLKEKVERSNG